VPEGKEGKSLTAPQSGDGWQQPTGPLGQGPRRRAYFVMMGICLLLIILAWTLIWRFSILAAVIMSAVALVIPPFAAIVANNGPVNRQ
jgi:Protein of unknown function (DUF3099)